MVSVVRFSADSLSQQSSVGSCLLSGRYSYRKEDHDRLPVSLAIPEIFNNAMVYAGQSMQAYGGICELGIEGICG